MRAHRLELPDDPAEALDLLLGASREGPCAVLKKSPACGISARAEEAWREWLAGRSGGQPLCVAEIDVLARRGLARGLTRELGLDHASPQVLVFRDGRLSWHGTHGALTEDALRAHAGD